MPAETLTIALPPETAALVHEAVGNGEYASSTEVLEDALHDWASKRQNKQLDVAYLREAWNEALADPGPGIDAEEFFESLERRYNVDLNPDTSDPA